MTRMLCRVAGLALLATASMSLIAAEVATTADDTDRETQQLLNQLKTVGEQILANTQSPNLYRIQLDQGEVLMRLAARSKADERDNWLRMAIDSYATAVSQAPENIPNPQDWLTQVSTYVGRQYPTSKVQSYIAYKGVHAEHMRSLVKGGVDAGKAQEKLCDRLMQFARANPTSVEAPKAVVEVLESHEANKRVAAAREACRFLATTYPKDALARRAKETLWRLGLDGEIIDLKLPMLYPSTPDSEEIVDLRTLGGRPVIVYFWSSANVVDEDLSTLREWQDQRRRQGLEIVFVNVDETPAAGRNYLSNKLTGGIHVHQKGGVESGVTGRYGIRTLPETLLINGEGALVTRAATPSGIETAMTKLLGPTPDNRRR